MISHIVKNSAVDPESRATKPVPWSDGSRNALEAMKDGGTLSVAVRGDGERVLLDVGDTGPGIDPAILGNVFDPFFTTKEAGTGLGLSIVRKIVDQHAGDVRIVSRPGEGTHVLVAIPMGREKPSGPAV